jgi:hypothetical protein
MYKAAQVKIDREGYQVGVFNNRIRPFEYNKTGTAAHGPPHSTYNP